MSNTILFIEERARNIGDFMVGRLLPFRKKRMVGPFIFIDHMGPVDLKSSGSFQIDQHPHIGLSTLTYLFEGEAIHRDSTGAVQRITPGSVNWMTAGKGAVHTERAPEQYSEGVHTMHGYQIWVALPKDKEQMTAEFHHVAKEDLPSWKEGNVHYKLVAGKAFNNESPVPVHSPLFMLHLNVEEDTHLDFSGKLFGEMGICVVRGSVEACGEVIENGNMLVSNVSDQCAFKASKGSLLLIFGGEPLPEKRLIWWNFVATEEALIDDAKKRWKNGEFKMVPNESGVIPLPG